MVRYLKKQQAMFSHIPRTGGTWVEKALLDLRVPLSFHCVGIKKGYPKKHSAFAQYTYRPGSMRMMFSFVRHPIAYYESVWKWLRRYVEGKTRRKEWKWHPFKSVSSFPLSDFNVWMCHVLEDEPLWYTRLIELYVGPNDGEWCNFIGRTETLVEDFILLMNSFGVKGIEKLMTIPNIHGIRHHVEWDGCLKERVLESERLVISRFYGEDTKDRKWFDEQS